MSDLYYPSSPSFLSQEPLNPYLKSNPEKATGQEQFFRLVEAKRKQFRAEIDQGTLSSHRIKVISSRHDDPLHQLQEALEAHGNNYVEFTQSKFNGLECEYNVILGGFLLAIKVLNLHRNSEEYANKQGENAVLGQGSSGLVKRVNVGPHSLAVKRIIFDKDRKELFDIPYLMDPEDQADPIKIRNAIKEYCVYKICSMFKVGPRVIFTDFYDLVCYNDCIEFQMELCESVGSQMSQTQFEQDIRESLAILHSLKFIHKDIKLGNTLYSPSKEGFVLTDFGMSHSVKEELHEQSVTMFEGTKTHASAEMLQIQGQGVGLVNLYKNDYHCMLVTFKEFKERNFRSDSFQDNSMSFGASYCDQYSNYDDESEEEQESSIRHGQTHAEQIVSPMATEHSARSYGDYSTRNSSIALELIAHGGQINFYEMKTLAVLLKSKSKPSLESVQEILLKQIPEQGNKVSQTVQKLIQLLLFSERPHDATIAGFQNAVRIFGVHSEEVVGKLREIEQRREISFLDYARVDRAIQIFSKYNKLMLKPFPNFIKDMNRQVFLRNRHSLTNAMRKLLKEYLKMKQYSSSARNQILLLGVELYNYDDLTKDETDDLMANLWKVLALSGDIKPRGQGQAACPRRLFNKIYQVTSKIEDKLEYRFYKVFMSYFLRARDEERVEQLIAAVNLRIECLMLTEDPQKQCDNTLLKIKYSLILAEYHHFNNHSEKLIRTLHFHFQPPLNFNQQLLRKTCLGYLLPHLINLNKMEQAHLANEEYLELVRSINFPRTQGIDFSYYYSYQGMIMLQNGNYEGAVESFQICLNNLDEAITSSTFVKPTAQALLNIALCYNKQQNYEAQLEALQRVYYYSCLHFFKTPETSIDILHRIIRTFFRLGKFDRTLAGYFDQAAYLKNQVLELQMLGADNKKFYPRIPFFDIAKATENIPVQSQNLIFVKKCMVSSIEPYLPKFLASYYNLCEQIAKEFIIQNRPTSKALPYIWKMFACFPKTKLSDHQFLQMKVYVDLLKKSNASRRALKFLKNYAHLIPSTYRNLQLEAFRDLSKLSTDLSTRDKQFYRFVLKERSYESRQCQQASMEKVHEQVILSEPIKRIWLKKLRAMRVGEQGRQKQINNEKQSSEQKVDSNQQSQAYLQVNSLRDLLALKNPQAARKSNQTNR